MSAKYEANKYTITFNAGKGSVDITSKEVTYDGNYGTLPTAERKDFTFEGWYTSVTDGIKIEADDVVDIEEDITLYAQYKTTGVLVTSIDFAYSATFLYSFKTYQVISKTILPENAAYPVLKYEIVNPSYSGLSIDETTGALTYLDDGSDGSCGTVRIKATAMDGSGVCTIVSVYMERGHYGCWTPAY